MLSPIYFAGSNPIFSASDIAKCRYSEVLSKALRSKVIGQYLLKDIIFPWTHFQTSVQNHKDTKLGLNLKLRISISANRAEALRSTQNR